MLRRVVKRLRSPGAIAWLCVSPLTVQALTPTPTPCNSAGAQLELALSASPAMPQVGDVVDLDVDIANPSGELAGLPSYSLTGAEPLFAVELVTAVTIALDGRPLPSCAAADSDGSGTVTIDDLIVALRHALDGCGAAAAP